MAICNKDFRVKHGLYVGTDIDASRGALSALSANVGGGYGDTGLTVSSIGDLSANGIGHFDGNLSTSGGLTVGGGYGDTGVSVSTSGDLSANGTITAASFAGAGTNLTTNFTISAGGDVDNVTTNVTALNGTYSLALELKNTAVTAGSYGSTSAIPTFTVDEDGRLTAAGTVAVSTTLNTAGDSGTGSVALGSQSLTIAGTSNEIETSASGQTITIGLPDNVTIGGDLTVTGNDIKDSGGSAAITFDGSQNVTTGGNLTVTGNLLVNGDTTTQNVSAVTVEDPVIKLGSNNVGDAVDLGFYGQYRVGSCSSASDNRYAGLIRDTSITSTSAAFVFFADTTTDILSANASGSSAPAVANYAPVYVGGIGIGTNASVASNKLTISGAISGDNNITIDGTANFKGNVTLGDASGDTLTINAETINPANIAAGTDNTVVVYNGSSLVTDEIDSRVWGTSLVDGDGTAGHVAFFTGASTIDSEASGELYWDSSNNRLGINTSTPNEALTVTGNISASAAIYADRFESTSGGSGVIDFNDNVDLSGTLSVTGTISGNSGLTINGNTTLGDASGDTLTINAETINPANIAAGTDNTVVVYNGSSLVTDEIDSKVWACNLVDYNNTSTANRLSKFIDTTGTIDDSRICDDGTNIVVGVGAANPVTFTGSSTSTSVKYNDTTGFHSLSTAVAATCTNIPVFTKAAADFRSGKVVVQSALGSTQYEVAELLLIHDGTDVHVTEYGNISTAATYCTSFSADINGGNVRILATNSHGSVDSVVSVATQQFLI